MLTYPSLAPPSVLICMDFVYHLHRPLKFPSAGMGPNAHLHAICIGFQISIPFSPGGWAGGQGQNCSFPCTSASCLCPPPSPATLILPPPPQGSPTLQQRQQEAKTNMGGKTVE